MASGLYIPKGARGGKGGAAGFRLDDRRLRRTFEKLPDRIGKKATRKIVNAGGTPILKAARKDAPVRFGFLKKSLKKRVRVYRDKVRSGIGVVIVGVDVSAEYPDPLGRTSGGSELPYKYVHWAHDGFTAPDGSWHEGDPFIKRARMIQEDAAFAAMAKKASQAIPAEAKKAGR